MTSLLVIFSLALHAFIPHHHHETVDEKIACHAIMHSGCQAVDGDGHHHSDDLHFDHQLDVEHSIINKVFFADIDWACDVLEQKIVLDIDQAVETHTVKNTIFSFLDHRDKSYWRAISHRGPPEQV